MAALLGTAVPAAAQTNLWGVATATTAPVVAVATLPALGTPLSVAGGPWVPAEVLFFSAGRVVADYAWRDSVRARRGRLYTAQDLQSDVSDLMTLGY